MDISKLPHLTATRAKTNLGSLIDSVNAGEGPYVIDRYGKPVAILMDMETFRVYEARRQLLKMQAELQREREQRLESAEQP